MVSDIVNVPETLKSIPGLKNVIGEQTEQGLVRNFKNYSNQSYFHKLDFTVFIELPAFIPKF